MGTIDGRPATLAAERAGALPDYCLFIRFRGEQIQSIRDYRYARHVFAEAPWRPGGGASTLALSFIHLRGRRVIPPTC
jgi:hypothetical protein